MNSKNPFTRAADISDKKAETLLAKSGRKPRAERDPDQEPVINEPAFAGSMELMRTDEQSHALAESQHQAHVRAVAAQLGYQLPNDCADPDLIQRDIALSMRRTAEAMLQVGLGLVCLKEACRHGEFQARLDVLRFEPRVAQKYMQVASRLSNAPSTAHLAKVVESQTKLLELIVLDDEQLEELALTGETGELKLDDVASMSVKELRAAVRELRGEVKAKETLLEHRSKQLDEAALIKAAPPDEQLEVLRKEATASMNDCRGALIGRFSAALGAVDAHYADHGGEPDLAFLAGLVGQLQADLAALRDHLGIPDVTPALIPEWVSDPSFGKAAD